MSTLVLNLLDSVPSNVDSNYPLWNSDYEPQAMLFYKDWERYSICLKLKLLQHSSVYSNIHINTIHAYNSIMMHNLNSTVGTFSKDGNEASLDY